MDRSSSFPPKAPMVPSFNLYGALFGTVYITIAATPMIVLGYYHSHYAYCGVLAVTNAVFGCVLNYNFFKIFYRTSLIGVWLGTALGCFVHFVVEAMGGGVYYPLAGIALFIPFVFLISLPYRGLGCKLTLVWAVEPVTIQSFSPIAFYNHSAYTEAVYMATLGTITITVTFLLVYILHVTRLIPYAGPSPVERFAFATADLYSAAVDSSTTKVNQRSFTLASHQFDTAFGGLVPSNLPIELQGSAWKIASLLLLLRRTLNENPLDETSVVRWWNPIAGDIDRLKCSTVAVLRSVSPNPGCREIQDDEVQVDLEMLCKPLRRRVLEIEHNSAGQQMSDELVRFESIMAAFIDLSCEVNQFCRANRKCQKNSQQSSIANVPTRERLRKWCKNKIDSSAWILELWIVSFIGVLVSLNPKYGYAGLLFVLSWICVGFMNGVITDDSREEMFLTAAWRMGLTLGGVIAANLSSLLIFPQYASAQLRDLSARAIKDAAESVSYAIALVTDPDEDSSDKTFRGRQQLGPRIFKYQSQRNSLKADAAAEVAVYGRFRMVPLNCKKVLENRWKITKMTSTAVVLYDTLVAAAQTEHAEVQDVLVSVRPAMLKMLVALNTSAARIYDELTHTEVKAPVSIPPDEDVKLVMQEYSEVFHSAVDKLLAHESSAEEGHSLRGEMIQMLYALSLFVEDWTSLEESLIDIAPVTEMKSSLTG
ncbi:hypothetical protein FOL47_010230 [Perkinsus chesapeaki]|uniref:Aluminum-activated malate transporter 1 n=1 Tax=Perkinsus chesapeaki TaxID=330153 RepID=A0A7J6L385_PERCH|nr:hypothetical protein FOL47_010230 [Perkinsus chesapeaki]